MKKRKSKFNFSNKLAYTLIVILCLCLFSIGVYAWGGTNPPTMGHSSGEIDLSLGVPGNAIFNGNVGIGTSSPQGKLHVVDSSMILNFTNLNTCQGASESCYTFSEAECENGDQAGCDMRCSGGEIYLTCGSFENQEDCESLGDGFCEWIGYCTDGGSWDDTQNCDLLADYECSSYSSYGCSWSCSGEATSCSSFSSYSTCLDQAGCSWSSVVRKIDSTGISMPKISAGSYCDALGNNCFRANLVKSTISSDTEDRWSTKRDSRLSTSSCPAGSYVYKIALVGDSFDHETHVVQAYCKTLPVAATA